MESEGKNKNQKELDEQEKDRRKKERKERNLRVKFAGDTDDSKSFATIINVESYKEHNKTDNKSDSKDENIESDQKRDQTSENSNKDKCFNNNYEKLNFGYSNIESANNKQFCFSGHIGKTILFLLSLVILGIVWYLNLVSSSILLVSLAVGFILFVTFAIWDQKKKIFPKPKKIWTDFRSRLGFGRSEQKENSNIPRTDNDINQSII